MVKKKKFWKSLFRQLKTEYTRFLSMIGIVLLGVGVITGLLVTTPNMQTSISEYYEDNNTADIFMKSTIGFDDDSLIEIENLESVSSVEGMKLRELKVEYNRSILQSVVYELDFNKDNRINKFTLIKGRLPNIGEKEVVVEQADFYINDFSINDYIEIPVEKDQFSSAEKECEDYKIVGIVSNPWYFSKEAEKTTSGAETIEAIIYKQIPEEPINVRYTDIFVKANFKNRSHTFSKEYKDESKVIIKEIETLKSSLMSKQTESLIDDLNSRDDLPDFIKTIAIKEIEDMDKDLYVLGRNANISYVTFDEFVLKVDSIAKIFPVFFLIVASLVVLTTMTRLVEEERLQIGISRALGYSKFDIYRKYIVYALLVGVIGTGLGYLAGFRLLPIAIYNAFEKSFFLPTLNMNVYSTLNLVVMGIMILSILLATIFAVRTTLKENPANLLRPRAPKAGKRILLERIPFIWKRLKFKYKSSLRNVFRYPKHLLMTVLGVAGSLALIFTGFGLNNSLQSITNTQFKEIYKYDLVVNIDGFDDNLKTYLIDNHDDYLSYMEKGYYLTSFDEKDTFYVDMLVFEDYEKLDKYLTLRNRRSKDELVLENDGVIITEQISRYLKVKKDDTFNIDGQTKDLLISGVTENYINSRIYMTKEFYDKTYNPNYKYKDSEDPEHKFVSTYVPNKILTNNINKLSEEKIEEKLLSIEGSNSVKGVDFLTGELESNKRLLDQINIIVVILVGAAGMLAVIVVYNLANVNISEREKEIATLKVLGYKQSEVSGYIFREIMIMTVFGIIVGVFLGRLMHLYIVNAIDTPSLMMGRDIRWFTYVISIGLTILFTLVVQFLMYFKIKKINMIEAMKEV